MLLMVLSPNEAAVAAAFEALNILNRKLKSPKISDLYHGPGAGLPCAVSRCGGQAFVGLILGSSAIEELVIWFFSFETVSNLWT